MASESAAEGAPERRCRMTQLMLRRAPIGRCKDPVFLRRELSLLLSSTG